ncbi:MAG TPA: AraC family transcriptional regulator [Puia sp.]|nr:AraC family transcriptional regulator [Puia sp.]
MKEEIIKRYDFQYDMQPQKILVANPTRQLTITPLALVPGVSSFKLHVGFKQVSKTPIHQYRLHLQPDFGKRLLSETDHTTGEIAHKTGFDSRDGFASCFRRKYRQVPENGANLKASTFRRLYILALFLFRKVVSLAIKCLTIQTVG